MFIAQDIKGLNATYPNVPYPLDPVHWDRRLGVAANISVIEGYMRQYSQYLPEGVAFDEAAIMVNHERVQIDLAGELLRSGWEQFNHAADLVYTNPLSTRYAVEYTFFQHPNKPYRLEVMLLGQPTADGRTGFSPLHQALWFEGNTPPWASQAELPIPHLSYKPPMRMTGARAVDLLTDQGFIIAQACQSTYGRFWYMAKNDARRKLYIKPRVNLRDGEEG
jgi:hypothetical protein